MFTTAPPAAAPSEGNEYPPPCVEITPEHPLLLFRAGGSGQNDAAGYARHVIEAWKTLSEDLRSFSVMQINSRGVDLASRHQWFREMLMILQDADIPVAIQLADSDLSHIYNLERAEDLVQAFPCIRGLEVTGLPFEEYYDFSVDNPLGAPPVVRWLIDAIDLAARNGRFIAIELDQIRWPRVMCNTWNNALYTKFAECKAYVAPIAAYRGPHTIAQTSALMGLWLEGAVNQWGVGPQSGWYEDAHFLNPGLFGINGDPSGTMPSPLYRAMILNGAMMGASVYAFATDTDLWFGSASRHWHEAILPTLEDLLEGGLIARQDFVRKKAKVAYQLAPARTPEDFHLNLRDIDGVLDKGFLARGAYGMERPGQVPELIPNTGRYYWIPLLSPHAPQNALSSFELIVKPGAQTSPESWVELLNQHYPQENEGAAFITRVGRGIFVFNSCENRYEAQAFRINNLPAPVRRFSAKRQEKGITISWPFREGDLSYKVFRRDAPNGRFTLLAGPLEARQFLDTTADPAQSPAYSVTALTDDAEPYEGTVQYGEYLVLSNVESRIAEEVILTPLLTEAESKPLSTASAIPKNKDATPWWPTLTGVSNADMPAATAIVKRIEDWDRAFTQKNLDAVMDLYAPEYTDPQGWQTQYVRRAYRWFFEHYGACCMHRQIRKWNFAEFAATGQVGVQLYCRFEGYAISDPTGRWADMHAWFPRTPTSEICIWFSDHGGNWQIIRTDPATPSFKDILSFSAGPFDGFELGPDQ